MLKDEYCYPESVILIDEAIIYEKANEAKSVTEPAVPKPTKSRMSSQSHLDHAEDLLIRKGERGFDDILSSLGKTYDYIRGRHRNGYSISMKFDGSPGILWGYIKGKFFVATKSFFNKTPKINFTEKDIATNHASSSSIQKKLKLMLKYLPAVTPKTGIFRGDLMFTPGDVSQDGDDINFTPNTLTYHVPSTTPEGKELLKAKIGLVPHMIYHEQENGDLKATFDSSLAKFRRSPDVYLFDPKITGPFDFPPNKQQQFASELMKARNLQKTLADLHVFDAIKDHEPLLLSYINSSIKEKKERSVAGYISFVQKLFKKHIEHVKLDKTKNRIQKEVDAELFRINQNKKGIETLFDAHNHIQNAKQVLVDVLSKTSPYKETILGKPSKPEGFVVSVHGQPVKLVDRKEFSAANFDWNTKVDPEDNPMVISWGRMNPMTAGHEKMMNIGSDIARRIGAKQKVIMSRSQDPEKNPLTPQEKLKWAKTLFPGKDIAVAGENEPTLIAQLQHMYNSGVKDLTMVAGSDRTKEYTKILARYNGPGENKLFNFKRVRVVSAGERDPDSEGIAGISASKVRSAAAKNDYKTFSSMIPKHVSSLARQDLFHTLRANQGLVKIGSDTPGIALSIYSKRKQGDKVGDDSRREIEKRKKQGNWTGK